MEDKKYRVVEWTIDNFCCWNGEIHEKVITSPKSPYAWGITFHLFPRGLDGHDEHLLLQIHSKGLLNIPREVSFVCSDGYILCTQQMDSREEQNVLELHPGLKFKDMVAHIRKAFLKNRIILILRLQILQESDSIENMRTTIDGFEVSFKVSPNILSYENSLDNAIALFVFPATDKKDRVQINLLTSKSEMDHSIILLSLKQCYVNKKVSVHTWMSVLNIEGVVRTEVNEHLFRGNTKKWTFSNSLTRNEITNEELAIILTITISPVYSHNNSVGLKSYADAIHPINLSEFKAAGTRVPKDRFSKSHVTVDSNQANNSLAVLSSELMCLYKNQDFCDFQLKCGDGSIPVHKNILSARSPVFKTMLSTDMAEAASCCMDIVDLDSSTLGLFLTYLYTGAVEELQCERALKLYYAADKYQVPSLKKECADFLCHNVSVSNVCDILSLADKHQDHLLISTAHDFLLDNYNEVLRSEPWKTFTKSEPSLVAETNSFSW